MKFKLTKRVRLWCIEKLGVAVDAADATFIKASAAALASGKITKSALADLCGTKADETSDIARQVAESVAAQLAKLLPNKKGADVKKPEKKKSKPANPITEQVNAAVDARLKEMGMSEGNSPNSPTALLGKSVLYVGPKDTIRVKSAIESYEATTKMAVCPERTMSGAKHPRAGMPATHAGRTLYHASERDKAVAGSFFKFSLASQSNPRDIPRPLQMTDHDKDIMQWALRNSSWTGIIKGHGEQDMPGSISVNSRKLSEMEIKALLDDSVSGGLEAAPIVFDDAVILTPVLYGELFPDVNVMNISRGRRIEGFSMSNPTFTSGTAEGTAITPFNTASFVSAFDTTIYNAVAAMEIGLDFEEDAPNDIGGIVTERYGLTAMAWLDEQIAVGDGVTEPEGIFTTAGTTTVNSDNGTGGPPTVSDYEGLMFGVAKEYRKEPGARTVFVGNETSYRRARAIPVGPADERRVFGMTHADYKMLDQDYRIQNSIGNSQIGYVNLKRYRMYRRLGLNIRIETAGNYLSLRNIKLIVLRMRFGGHLELGGAAAIMSDSQS
jgi:HK97 family phage major capsid protein